MLPEHIPPLHDRCAVFGSNAVDLCGDLTSANNPIYSSIQSISVACNDLNAMQPGHRACLSWSQDPIPLHQPAAGVPRLAVQVQLRRLPGITIQVPGRIKVDKVTWMRVQPYRRPDSFSFSIRV